MNYGSSMQKPQWDLSSLIPFEKCFYHASSTIMNRPAEEVNNYRYSIDLLSLISCCIAKNFLKHSFIVNYFTRVYENYKKKKSITACWR